MFTPGKLLFLINFSYCRLVIVRLNGVKTQLNIKKIGAIGATVDMVQCEKCGAFVDAKKAVRSAVEAQRVILYGAAIMRLKMPDMTSQNQLDRKSFQSIILTLQLWAAKL